MANFPFFSCSIKLPPCETMQPFKVLPVLAELEVVPVALVFWPAVLCPDMEPGCEFGSGDGAPPVPFPPLRLILGLRPRNETASRTPWWLLLLRLAIAASVIFAMAGPVLNPLPAVTAREGALLIVLDDGWPAAPGWERRIAAAARRIEAAERNSLRLFCG